MARAPSQGADPSTSNKQRAPTQEPALVKVKRVLPWCPGLFLSCLGFPFVCAGGFFGLRLLGLLLCPCVFWLVLAVGVAFQLPGGRDVGSVFFSFSVDGHRPEYRLFQVSLYVCPSGVLLRARARLSCLFNGFLLHQCGHRSLCQRALLGFHKGLRGFYILSGVADAGPMLTLLVTGRVSQYVLRDYRHLDHDQRDLGGKPCNFSAALALAAFLFRRSVGVDC